MDFGFGFGFVFGEIIKIVWMWPGAVWIMLYGYVN